jgi:hypothetical protein
MVMVVEFFFRGYKVIPGKRWEPQNLLGFFPADIPLK